jgi:hypothetical protein
MSAKWVRSQRWDDRHLTGPLMPIKWLLRLFSGIPFAIVLLTLVALYGVLASIPLGLLLLIPTKAFYGLTLLVFIVVICALPTWWMQRALRTRGVSGASRFVISFVAVALLGFIAFAAWYTVLWPHIRFTEVVTPTGVTRTGLRFLSDTIDAYANIPVRRLPGMEMSELEFYSWWPLTLVLVLFVINLTVATIRRIEFTFPRVGVLMVHTGIILIALGSVYYSSRKQEGDMALLFGGISADGTPRPGPAKNGFYDNRRTALWVSTDKAQGWEIRPLAHVPRYNDYNLDVVPRADARPDWSKSLGALDIRVPGEHITDPNRPGAVGDSLKFRVVGYASYAELQEQWVEAPKGQTQSSASSVRMRTLTASAKRPEGADPSARTSKTWRLRPDRPQARIDTLDVMSVEYTIGMSEQRWNDLITPLPQGQKHGLIVEIPSKSFRAVYAVSPEQEIKLADTGYTLKVQQILEQPPFAIVTKGYQGATSSLAIVHVTPPGNTGAFERWVYSRFPEINQDMLDEKAPSGMPKRRDPDASIRIAYIDASRLQVNVDESSTGDIRSVVRFFAEGQPRVSQHLKFGDSIQIAPALTMSIGEPKNNVVSVEVPVPVHPDARDKQNVGTHQSAAIAVEITDSTGRTQTRWLPFTKYLDTGQDTSREITLGDGKTVHLAFGRVFHEFVPPMQVSLVDFKMTPYPHSQVPKDFRSDLLVRANWGERELVEMNRKTSLNDPLLVRTPFVGRADLPGGGVRQVANALGWAFSLIAPNQYKFSQAGWDQAGWRETEAEAEAGRLPRPFARFTILGVGNNPGIYIIALGAVMMSVGIPWAFYLKPWLMQRQKRKIQQQLASEGKLPKHLAQPTANGISNGSSMHPHTSEATKSGGDQ